MEYRAITIHQPYASAIADGWKKYETRTWDTNFRGRLLIHAGVKQPKQELLNEIYNTPLVGREFREWFSHEPYQYTGRVVAIANLHRTYRMTGRVSCQPGEICIRLANVVEKTLGNWQEGNYAWMLENVVWLPEPVLATGKQRLWIPSDSLIAKVEDQIGDRFELNDTINLKAS